MKATTSIALGCILVATLSGCSTFEPVPGKYEKLRNYTVGETRTVTVGDPIFRVQSGVLTEGWEVTQDYDPPQWNVWTGGHNYPRLQRGTLFGVIARNAEGALRLSSPEYVMDQGKGIAPIKVDILPSGVVDGTPLTGGSSWSTDTLFRRSDRKAPVGKIFKAELNYTGLTGSTVRATYREFIDDLARPAFSTELQYNLEESKEIAYKSIRIQVESATNSTLRVRVVSDDDLPWLP